MLKYCFEFTQFCLDILVLVSKIFISRISSQKQKKALNQNDNLLQYLTSNFKYG